MMTARALGTKGVLVGLFVLLSGLVLLRENGAPPRSTGAPGEPPACGGVGCHTSFAVDTGTGRVRVTGPATYAPGQVVRLRVRVEEAGARAYGFQITARDGAGQAVGTWELVDGETQYSANTAVGRQYVTHNRAGVLQEWAVAWRAPAAAAGPVTLYAAGNAADGSGTPEGDRVYTFRHVLSPGSPAGTEAADVPTRLQILGTAPNPFRDRATVRYTLDQPAAVTVRLYDTRGRLVQVHEAGLLPAGTHAADLTGAGLVPGLYLCEVWAGGARAVRPVVHVE